MEGDCWVLWYFLMSELLLTELSRARPGTQHDVRSYPRHVSHVIYSILDFNLEAPLSQPLPSNRYVAYTHKGWRSSFSGYERE